MIKKCKVLLQNESVLVALFDKTEIQFPSIKEAKDEVNVKYENGFYEIVSNDETTNDAVEGLIGENTKSNTMYKKL